MERAVVGKHVCPAMAYVILNGIMNEAFSDSVLESSKNHSITCVSNKYLIACTLSPRIPQGDRQSLVKSV